MGKDKLITAVADRTGLSQAEAARVVNSVVGIITEALKKGTEVRIVGFGTFCISRRAARVGRNPQTVTEIRIPDSKQPKFIAAKALRRAIGDGGSGG